MYIKNIINQLAGKYRPELRGAEEPPEAGKEAQPETATKAAVEDPEQPEPPAKDTAHAGNTIEQSFHEYRATNTPPNKPVFTTAPRAANGCDPCIYLSGDVGDQR